MLDQVMGSGSSGGGSTDSDLTTHSQCVGFTLRGWLDLSGKVSQISRSIQWFDKVFELDPMAGKKHIAALLGKAKFREIDKRPDYAQSVEFLNQVCASVCLSMCVCTIS